MNIKYWKTTAALLGVSAGTLMIAALSASPAYAWGEQEGAGASQCADPAVDDAGTSIGTCEVNNVRQAFVKLFTARAGTFLTSLASTSGGAPCAATGINNAAAGSEIITGGSCTMPTDKVTEATTRSITRKGRYSTAPI